MHNMRIGHLHLAGLVATVIILAGTAGSAMAKDTIRWIMAEEPPITYLQGGQYIGYGMEMLRMLQEDMPEYNHEEIIAGNYKRVIREVKDGPLACAIGLFRTPEREESMHFPQVPFFYFFDIQIAMRQATFFELGKPKVLSLREMLNLPQHTLGLSAGRTYSAPLRAILDEKGDSANIYIRPHGDVAEGLFNMLLINRIDYMLLYPDEAMYLSQKGEARNAVVTVPIEEAFNLGDSWCACTRSAAGEAAAEAITKALIGIRTKDTWRTPYEKWISPNLIRLYRKKFKTEFLPITKE